MEKIWSLALFFLGKREYSQKHLREKLQKSHPDKEALIEEVLLKLIKEDWQSDSRFARAYTRHLWLSSAKSPRQIVQTLWQKGIEGEIANPIVDEEIDKESIQKRLTHVIEKKLKKAKTKAQKQKIIESLMRKGYQWSEIEEALSLVQKNEQ